jgi:hypothetical protein
MTAIEAFRSDLNDDLIEEANQMIREGDATVEEAVQWLQSQGVKFRLRQRSAA